MMNRWLIICWWLASLISTESNAQMVQLVKSLETQAGLRQQLASALSDDQKMAVLAKLLPDDSVQFQRPDYDPDFPEPPRYYPLDTAGLFFFDFDADNDLDLIYTGESGLMGRMGTKFYLNKDEKLHLRGEAAGVLLDITEEKGGYTFYTVEYPCCDSYTTRFSIFKPEEPDKPKAPTTSIDLIGNGRSLHSLPNFGQATTEILQNPTLYASPDDFRGTSPYFGERSKAIRDSLRAGHFLPLIHLEGPVEVKKLGEKKLNETMWTLVITEPLADLPPSLYERSASKSRRVIGWVPAIKDRE
jgi:hypothetical protein